MDKESIYLLQKIDCNCNDCKHMIRDFDEFKKWEAIEKDRQQKLFDKEKAKAMRIAEECKDPVGRKTLFAIARKMSFTFDKQHLLHYGTCEKFDKPVSFIPNVCQLGTQECFEHRRAMVPDELTVMRTQK